MSGESAEGLDSTGAGTSGATGDDGTGAGTSGATEDDGTGAGTACTTGDDDEPQNDFKPAIPGSTGSGTAFTTGGDGTACATGGDSTGAGTGANTIFVWGRMATAEGSALSSSVMTPNSARVLDYVGTERCLLLRRDGDGIDQLTLHIDGTFRAKESVNVLAALEKGLKG